MQSSAHTGHDHVRSGLRINMDFGVIQFDRRVKWYMIALKPVPIPAFNRLATVHFSSALLVQSPLKYVRRSFLGSIFFAVCPFGVQLFSLLRIPVHSQCLLNHPRFPGVAGGRYLAPSPGKEV
jgi:hypothetical protein